MVTEKQIPKHIRNIQSLQKIYIQWGIFNISILVYSVSTQYFENKRPRTWFYVVTSHRFWPPWFNLSDIGTLLFFSLRLTSHSGSAQPLVNMYIRCHDRYTVKDTSDFFNGKMLLKINLLKHSVCSESRVIVYNISFLPHLHLNWYWVRTHDIRHEGLNHIIIQCLLVYLQICHLIPYSMYLTIWHDIFIIRVNVHTFDMDISQQTILGQWRNPNPMLQDTYFMLMYKGK